jgi:hypothetical protein
MTSYKGDLNCLKGMVDLMCNANIFALYRVLITIIFSKYI